MKPARLTGSSLAFWPRLAAGSTGATRCPVACRAPDAPLPRRRHLVAWSLPLLLAIAMLRFGPASAADAPVVEAGWIEDFEGPADGYALTRDGERLPVLHLMSLYAGDRLAVLSAGGLLRIRLADDRPVLLDKRTPPYEVPSLGSPPTLWSNLLGWASRWVGDLQAEPPAAETVIAVSRGGDDEGPPVSGLLYTETVGLAAGHRPLALAWRGGKAPFSVSVSIAPETGGAEPLLARTDIAERSLSTPPLDLRPGPYLLLIRDAAGERLITRLLVVVETAEVPSPNPEAIPADLPAPVRATLVAAWLAGQEDGWAWRLEAYQRLAAIQDYPPAERLREALLEDEVLPAPPAP